MYVVALLLIFFTVSCTSHNARSLTDSELPIIPVKKAEGEARAAHIFFLIQSGKIEEAIDQLQVAWKEDPYLLHSDVIEKLGLAILEQGGKSQNSDDVQSSLYGLSISLDERALPIVYKALRSDNPQLERTALSVLATLNTDHANAMLEEAMKSDYIMIRLEAAYLLAVRRAQSAFAHIDTLMLKVPDELRPLFAELYALDGSKDSIAALRRLLFDPDVSVRAEAILATAHARRDDLLPEIYRLAKEPSIVQQEACAYALGSFCDEGAASVLQQIAASGSSSASLAASYALACLGHVEFTDSIIGRALQGDVFAIQLLGKLPNTDRKLATCLESDDVNVRVNTALALLEKKDDICLDTVAGMLIDSHRDFAYQPIQSLGKSLRAWKAIPSSSSQSDRTPYFFEISLQMREELLTSSLELPESEFLSLARLIFLCQQHDLIPHCVRLLENLHSQGAIALLKEQEERVGSPFIRAWCRLALFRMNQPGPYAEAVRELVTKTQKQAVFQARPLLPWGLRVEDGKYGLTFEESARLLIESFEALAQKQDEEGLKALLLAIRNGNVHNRYTLAGLLIRASH